MSAPHIPTLTGRRSPFPSTSIRSRARGRGGFGKEGSPAELKEAQDKIVQQTDQDATFSRVSAVEFGYLNDTAVLELVGGETPRRFPIINRGTYVRTTAIDSLVEKFLEAGAPRKKQIISLGAGSDTRYFRLRKAYPNQQLLYHEIDFPDVTTQKISSIRRSSQLRSEVHLDTSEALDGPDSGSLYSSEYNIHPIDLRQLAPTQDDDADPLWLRNVDSSLPTLLISECCLIYLLPAEADSILRYFSTHVFPTDTSLGIILYEPIRPNDSFGRVMVQNLATRGIVLQTLKKYASLTLQKERLRMMGFKAGQASADIDFIWERWVSDEEKDRVAKLEMLDEVEEWRMLAQHYCVAWGWRAGAGAEVDDAFAKWRDEVIGQAEAY